MLAGWAAPGVLAHAATGDIGYVGPSYSGVKNQPTSDKPQSKLWYNDGSWWADMYHSASSSWHIFRLDRPTETWVDTGTKIDSRNTTLADTLWDGTHLYVASHYVTISSPSAPKASVAQPSRLYRFSYSAATKTYSLDAGFPATIGSRSTESLTLDKDSKGVLWAAWTQVSGNSTSGFTNAVYVSSTNGSDSVWRTPVVIPVSGANPAPDDISAVVAYQGRIGVMWSNQLDDTMYWAWRNDTEPSTSWHGGVAVRGNKLADDHMNLKTIQADSAGRVYAAVKTSLDELYPLTSSQPQINLLVFKPATGSWSSSQVGSISECHTRPIVMLDTTNSKVRVYLTAPSSGSCSYSGKPGTIYEKTASLDNPVFASGRGTAVIRDAASANMNNATSTKQSVSAATGLVVLAGNSSTKRYWHADISLGTVAAPTASFTASTVSGTAPLTVNLTDTSTGGPTSWAWNLGDGTTSSLQNPSVTYTTPGTYTVSLTASNTGGASAPATRTVTVSPAGPAVPESSFTSSTTSGTAPLTVSFTDTSTNSPTSWAWDLGNGSTPTTQNASTTYTTAGTYTVTLAAGNAGGTDTTPATATITVTGPPPPAPVAGLSASATSGTAPLAVNFTDTSTNNPTSWSWTFGDGTSSTGQNPSHTYTTAGSYTVSHTATNAGGTSSPAATTTITVNPPPAPVADFTASATSGSAPLSVSFTDTSSNDPTSWSWNLGNGQTSTLRNPSATYTAAGTYTVTLTATNAGGPSIPAATSTITVSPASATTINRESVATTDNTVAENGITIATPSGTTAGDVLVTCVVMNGSAMASNGVPAGWSLVAASTGVSNPKVYGYYKVATASEPATYRWGFSGTIVSSGGIARYSGSSGLDGAATKASGASSTSAVAPGVTTTTGNAMLVGCAGLNSGSASITIASPAAMTQAWDNGGSAKRGELADGLQATAGASGDKTWTFSSGREWAAWLVALRPL